MASLAESYVESPKEKSDLDKSLEKTKCGTEEHSAIELLLKQLPVLNDYFLLHNKIGKGTFSSVYLATLRNSKSTRKYAVKHLTQYCEQSRIENELKCLQEIGGKDNVVPAELCLSNGKNCVTFIMPYLPHLKFSDYVIDMDVEETRFYMKNLFIALKRVHSFNIIHRDVKPDNFLYDRKTKQFLLVDFGLAQVVCGSPMEINKGLASENENAKVDGSKKRKRNSSEDEGKHVIKPNKRMALKSKDNNIKICFPKFIPGSKNNNEKSEIRANMNTIIKKWKNKTDAEKVLLKSTTYSSESINFLGCENSAPSQNKMEDVVKENTNVECKKEEMKNCTFTPLVSGNLPSGKFVQVLNPRGVRQHAESSTSGLFPNQSFPKSFGQSCLCSGKGAVCSVCKARNPMCAPRAGTSGFRPPEVLFKYLHQTTAVDIWASGVVMLCILSGCYPFFKSSSDLVSLAEIMTIFGTDRMVEVAAKFGRRIICSQNSKGVDLKKLCVRLRARAVKKSKTKSACLNEPKCWDCLQALGKTGCLCPSSEVSNEEEKHAIVHFPDSAYDLLYRLMDLNPTTRITAAEALNHPFIKGV